MSANGIFPIVFYFGALIALGLPLGAHLARVSAGALTFFPALALGLSGERLMLVGGAG
jgi:hypothetical protein